MSHPNIAHERSLTRSERLARYITARVGTMGCAVVFAILTFISLPAVILSRDPVVIVAWITQTFFQLVLLPIIIVGQNLQGRHSEFLADATWRDAEEINATLKKVLAAVEKP